MPFLPIALFGLAVLGWKYLTDKDSTTHAMVGADDSGAFNAYPKGCTGNPLVKAHSVPDGGVYRLNVWCCEGTPYSHYVVAQKHLTPDWIGFRVYGGKRKFWRGSGPAAELNQICIDLGVTK